MALSLGPEVFHELNPIGTVLAYDDAGKDKAMPTNGQNRLRAMTQILTL